MSRSAQVVGWRTNAGLQPARSGRCGSRTLGPTTT